MSVRPTSRGLVLLFQGFHRYNKRRIPWISLHMLLSIGNWIVVMVITSGWFGVPPSLLHLHMYRSWLYMIYYMICQMIVKWFIKWYIVRCIVRYIIWYDLIYHLMYYMLLHVIKCHHIVWCMTWDLWYIYMMCDVYIYICIYMMCHVWHNMYDMMYDKWFDVLGSLGSSTQ